MELNDYQQYAAVTSKFASHNTGSTEHITMCILGLCGETGETADYIKKVMFHNHDLNHEVLIQELGDVLWYIAELATALGLKLNDVGSTNLQKLNKRYGSTFSTEASINRTV